MSPRLPLLSLLVCCCVLTSCGTASHYLGMAGGLVNSITSPVLGAIRLSDTPALDKTSDKKPVPLAKLPPTGLTGAAPASSTKSDDDSSTPSKRPD